MSHSVYEPVPLDAAGPKVEMSNDDKMEDVCRRVVRSIVREWLVDMNAKIFAAWMSDVIRDRDEREGQGCP